MAPNRLQQLDFWRIAELRIAGAIRYLGIHDLPSQTRLAIFDQRSEMAGISALSQILIPR